MRQMDDLGCHGGQQLALFNAHYVGSDLGTVELKLHSTVEIDP